MRSLHHFKQINSSSKYSDNKEIWNFKFSNRFTQQITCIRQWPASIVSNSHREKPICYKQWNSCRQTKPNIFSSKLAQINFEALLLYIYCFHYDSVCLLLLFSIFTLNISLDVARAYSVVCSIFDFFFCFSFIDHNQENIDSSAHDDEKFCTSSGYRRTNHSTNK